MLLVVCHVYIDLSMLGAAAKPHMKMARAKHAFRGDASKGQLTFKKGKAIEVLGDMDGDWWNGRVWKDGAAGGIGMFPATYVEWAEQEAAAAAATDSRPNDSKDAERADFEKYERNGDGREKKQEQEQQQQQQQQHGSS